MVRFVGWLLFFGLLGHAGSVAAQTVTYSFGGVDYPTQAQAESAMRAAHWPAGVDLYPCGATQGSPTDTRLSYCTPTRVVLHWHDQYTASSPYTITCGHSNDRLADYCATEGEVMNALVGHWQTANPHRCPVGQSFDGGYRPTSMASWAVNSYNPGTGTRRYASLNRNEPALSERRRAHITHQPCDDPEGLVGIASFYIQLAQHYNCPAGYEPQRQNFGPWPYICSGPTAQIIKRDHMVGETNPHSCAPCVPATGEKLLFEDDFSWGGVSFQRLYASMRDEPSGSALDPAWSHTWNELLKPTASTSSTARAWWRNAQGDFDEFRWVQGSTTQMYSVNTNSRRLVREPAGTWLLRDAGGSERRFDNAGRLLAQAWPDEPERNLTFTYTGDGLAEVTDARGRQLEFEHDSGRLVEIRIKEGATLVQYAYDSSGQLIQAIYPDGKTRSYLYAEPANMCVDATGPCSASDFPNRITGVFDENTIRVLTVTYDEFGRVVDSTRPLGDQATNLQYHPTSMQRQMEITGQGRSEYLFESSMYRRPLSRALYDGSTLIGTETWEYPSNKLSTRHTNRNGVSTRRIFNAVGLQTELIEAERKGANSNLPERRTTETTWSADSLPRPVETVVRDGAGLAVLAEEVVYNARGQVESRTLIDPATSQGRVTQMTFCEAPDVADPLAACPIEGLVRTVTAPGGAVTTFRYRDEDHSGCAVAPHACEWRKGDLWQTIGPEGHVVEVLAYDAAGRAVSMHDPNGVRTDLTFNSRGHLVEIVQRGSSASQDAVTSLTWTDDGLLASVEDPDGVVLTREYDAAGRLVALEDSLGNLQELTLDAGGNVIQEDVRDAAAVVVRTLSRVFDGISRVASEADAFTNATDLTWDAAGNLLTATDAAGTLTQNTYDNLDRLVGMVQDVGGIAAAVAIEYDTLDRVTKVTDPKGLDTGYAYNAFGDLLELDSPDTGVTAFIYDAAGNLASREDARGVLASYTHDDLGRVTAVDYPGTAEDVAYTWDVAPGTCGSGETFGAGRLGTMVDGSGSTAYCYDRRGNLVRKVQTTGGIALQVRYGYTLADRLAWIEYPDGTRVDYGRNANGDVASVAVTRPGQSQQVLVSGVDWHPFGPPAAIEWAGGRLQLRDLDAAGQPILISDGEVDGLSAGFGFSAVGNLTSITDLAAMVPTEVSLGYDPLGRLTGFLDGQTALPIESYGYDATGNRALFEDGNGSQIYSYPSHSHRLTSVDGAGRTYDAAGNTLTIGSAWTYTYGQVGRMATASDGTMLASYAYTGAGEQVQRTAGGSTTLFLYDEVGQLLGQYDGAGSPIQQYIWMDTLPTGVIADSTVYHVQTDHLGTPRAVIDPVTDTTIWSWSILGEAFGDTIPNEDPDGDSSPFVFDLRFPGQRFDRFSGLNNNYFREYDVMAGRYSTSDPDGLKGGLSTYTYASSSPYEYIDPEGLQFFPYSRNLNRKDGHRIPDDVALQMNHAIGGTLVVGAGSYFTVVGGVATAMVAPEVFSAGVAICRSDGAKKAALRACIALGTCSPSKNDLPDKWVQDVRMLQLIREQSRRWQGVPHKYPAGSK